MINFGLVPSGAVLPVIFDSYAGATGASITITGLAVTDIEIYKGGSATQRSSDNGYTLIDTDGIDIDGITGIHGFTIDTGDNTDAGFYAVGSFFTVVVSAITVDSQTVNFVAATFRMGTAESVAGQPKVDAAAVGGQAASAAGTVTFPGTIASTTNITAAAGCAVSSIGNNVITAASINADAITDAKVASDVTISSVTGAVGSVTGNVGGNVVGTVASVVGNVGGNVVGTVASVVGAVGSVTGNVGGNVVGTVASVVGNVGGSVASVTAGVTLANNSVTAAAIAADGGAEIADAVWDELLSGHVAAGSAGAALSAAGTAADPWATALPGAYGAGTAGSIVGNNLDTTVGSRLATGGYTAPPSAATVAAAVLTTAVTESYRANGAAPTLAQAACETLAHLGEAVIAGTTKTINKLDHVTPAETFTLDSATDPTSITRAT